MSNNTIDDLLREHAQRWAEQRRSSPLPDLGSAVVHAMETPSTTRRPGPARIAVIAAVAAVAIVAVGIGAVWRHNGSEQPAASGPVAADSIQVSGRTVPYAGVVPWSDAVADETDPRVIYIYADGDNIHGDVCGLPEERVEVSESANSVRVLVAGYATPLPANTSCAGVGHDLQMQRVELHAPLGNRPLIDISDDKTHPILDPTTIPRVDQIPTGFAPQPLRWNEDSGLVTRLYGRGPTGTPAVILDYGPPAAINQQGPPNGTPIATVNIGTATADVWYYTDIHNNITTLQWTVAGDREIRLTAAGPPTRHLTTPQAIAIAQSVR